MDKEQFAKIESIEPFLSEKEYFKIKNEGGWNEEKFNLISEIIKLTKLNSKNPNFTNTIAYTNFFREHAEECVVEKDLYETIKRFKNKIFEDPEAKEFFTREIKDVYYIIKNYIKIEENYVPNQKYLFPSRKGIWKNVKIPLEQKPHKNGWKNLDLEIRKNIDDYIFMVSQKARKTDEKMIKKIEILKNINLDVICRWIEYMALWSTAVGGGAELYIYENLVKLVPEVKWRWPDNEEDVKNFDVVGEINGTEIPIQVKLDRSARQGEGGLDVKEVFIIYCKELHYGAYKICPIKFGFDGWSALFKKIAEKSRS